MIQKILLLASNPSHTARLRLDVEAREISEGLKRSKRREEFELIQVFAPRIDDLRRSLLDHSPQIVHFCGHGAGAGGILLENNEGNAFSISTDALAGLFELCADHVNVAILNACYSEEQAEALSKHIRYVVGMRQSVSDPAAIRFAVAFYDALGSGREIESSFKFGCNAIAMYGLSEDKTPILKKKHFAVEPHNSQPEKPVSGLGLGEAFATRMRALQVRSRIRDSMRAVASHPEYPLWMSVSDTLVKNPIWESMPKGNISPDYHPAGPTLPKIMHLDMLLIRRNDERGHGQLYTYFSPDWGADLLTFRQRFSDEEKTRRHQLSAEQIARHWQFAADLIEVKPLKDKYAISVKPHPKYRDLIFYVFEFCSVTINPAANTHVNWSEFLDGPNLSGRWVSLSYLRSNEKSWSVNGDVIRALHELFTYDLGALPPFCPDESVGP
ncbi:CHAT domain-containing protein [Bradyrhizobium ontarionense]|uniref:CHAT domain-containing protein n=1 Tax=Bradyrhizobium ontarionense TaxID=2898149 RepID=A0ABY3RFM0_9BRAD|nr:CHAT domain-containing protein [Bradyrhizobium sp. A19]UFZ06245.1 CHAT domain-containing protein [Bradyrhizobium sp. A19]